MGEGGSAGEGGGDKEKNLDVKIKMENGSVAKGDDQDRRTPQASGKLVHIIWLGLGRLCTVILYFQFVHHIELYST